MSKYAVTKPYFSNDEIEMIRETIESGWVAQGSKVASFEKEVATHEGIAEGIATTSCTAALHLEMVAKGLGKGMDAIVPAFTFEATENAIVMTGATPVFCDVDSRTFNIDVQHLRRIIAEQYDNRENRLVNKKSGNTLWGIVPVHQFGLCCDIYEINAIAEEYSLQVIEDAACALGAKIGNVHQGGFGNTSCISFHPRKSITTGEGGMVLTDDLELAKHMRALRNHGCSVSADVRDKSNGFLLPEYAEVGYNYRMTDIQGAMGLAQIKKLDTIIEIKRKAAKKYNDIITTTLPEFIIPVESDGYYHTYQSYVCMLNIGTLNIESIKEGGEYRNDLLQRLEKKGIATRQGTHAVHMLGYYKNRFGFDPEDFMNAYACDHLSITLPLYVGISNTDQDYIIRTIRNAIDEMKR